MNKMFSDINMTDEQREDIAKWCKYIGVNRYNSIFKYLSKTKSNIDGTQLINYVKYDFRLADLIFSSIKFIELHLRTAIVACCGDKLLHKCSYIYELSEYLSEGKNRLDCSKLHNDKNIKDSLTVEEYLETVSLNKLINIYMLFDDDYLNKQHHKPKHEIKKELKIIKEIRNNIAHCKTVIDGIRGNSKAYKIAELFDLVMSYLPDKGIVVKRRDELNKINELYKIDNFNDL